MERLDKVIARELGYSRNDVKKLIKDRRIMVNDEIVLKSDLKVGEEDKIVVDGEEIGINKCVYLVLNKPQGYVSATKDGRDVTVLDLVPYEYLHRNLFPVGRLDKDTTGLMIITDDGEFAHYLLTPRNHIKKMYRVVIDKDITEEMVKGFREGVKLNDGECKMALLEKIDNRSCYVTLTEGRYHQIKRMFGCYGTKVLELERVRMGELDLPKDLERGECRLLKDYERELLQK